MSEEVIYKFASPAGIDYLLERQTVRFATPSVLNDLNEAVPNVGRILDREMRRAALSVFHLRATLNPRWEVLSPEEFCEVLYGHQTLGPATSLIALRGSWLVAQSKFRRFGVLSLTETRDDLLMWAHYCGESGRPTSGLCVGFSRAASVFQESEYASAGLKGVNSVQYASRRADFDAETLDARLAEIVLTKSDCWAYERELRCIRELPEGHSQLITPFAAKDVQEILLGPNMPLSEVKRCSRLRNEKFPAAKLLIAVPHPEEFRMLFYPCPDAAVLDWVLKELPDDVPALGLPSGPS